MPVLSTPDIISHMFLITAQIYGEKFWVHIVKTIYDHETKLAQYLGKIHLISSVNDEKHVEIISYNEIINHIKKYKDEDIVCNLKHIVAHEGTLIAYHPNSLSLSNRPPCNPIILIIRR